MNISFIEDFNAYLNSCLALFFYLTHVNLSYEKINNTFDMSSTFQIVGLILLFAMLFFFYRNSIKDIFKTPKESFLLSIPIIFMGFLFYIFFKSKGF